MPAVRSVCGFAGVGAYRGCHRCEKVFTHVPGSSATGLKSDAGGFQPAPARTSSGVRAEAGLWQSLADTKQRQKETFHLTGVRWCQLLRLPYFDPVRMVVIDPMHNMCLGTGLALLHLFQDLPLRRTPLLRPGNPYEADSPYRYRGTYACESRLIELAIAHAPYASSSHSYSPVARRSQSRQCERQCQQRCE